MNLMVKAGTAALATVALGASAEAKPLGYLYPSVIVASDYRYDGYSNSGREPVLQGSLYLYRPDGYYAGIFSSNAKVNAPGSPSWELDYYLGKDIETKNTKYKFEAMYTTYPDNEIYGPTLDFLQVKAAATRKINDRLSLGLSLAYVPEGSYQSGVAIKLVSDASYKITPWLSLNGLVGKRWIERGYDSTFWEAGAAAKWKAVTLDVRYSDTDLEPEQCFYTNSCKSAVVAKLQYDVPLKYKFNTWK